MTGPCARCQRDRSIKARGLCDACYSTCRKNRTLVDYPRSNRRLDDVLDDYRLLKQNGVSRADCAGRLGMSVRALDRALCRGRVAGKLAS